jgi:hypothetical protein
MTQTVVQELGSGLLVFSRGKPKAAFGIEYDSNGHPTQITSVSIEGYSFDEAMKIIEAIKSIVHGGIRGEKY